MKICLLILIVSIISTPLLVNALIDEIVHGVADATTNIVQASADAVDSIDDRIYKNRYRGYRGYVPLGRRHVAYSSAVTRYSPNSTVEQLTDLYALNRLNDLDVKEIEMDRIVKPDSIVSQIKTTISNAGGKQAYLIQQALAGTIDIRDVRSSLDVEQFREFKFKAREKSLSLGHKWTNWGRPNATAQYNLETINNK